VVKKIIIVAIVTVITVVVVGVVINLAFYLMGYFQNRPLTILSQSGKYEAKRIERKSLDLRDRIIIKKNETGELIDMIPVVGRVKNIHWSPQEDFIAIETQVSRIQVRDIMNRKDVPINCDLFSASPNVWFREWSDKGLIFSIEDAKGGWGNDYLLKKDGTLQNYGLFIH
jgi:hypothetical protein